MAGMKRFVTYIYSYEDEKKGNNVGFAKIEIRGEECRIEIHLREVYIGAAGCMVYLFRRENGEMEGVPLGKMQLARGAGDFGVRFRETKIGNSPYGVSQMEGIFLLGEDGSIFMSRWTEGPALAVSEKHFREWQPGADQPETPQQSTETQRQSTETQQESPGENRTAVNTQQESPGAGPAAAGRIPESPAQAPTGAGAAAAEIREENRSSAVDALPREQGGADPQQGEGAEEKAPIMATELGAMKIPARNVFPDYHWPWIWDGMCQKHEVGTPFVNKEVWCMQLELKELRDLPRRYWYLGNNSFLLHGYFNYQYLILGKTEGPETRWLLGVPGIYQRQERVMAAIFGFPDFLAADNGEGEIDKNAEPINRFGCWVRYIEE